MSPRPAVSALAARPLSNTGRLVVIGASAGGLHSLLTILEPLPKDLPCCIVIATHLSGTHISLLPELLARKTSLRVLAAQNDTLAVGTVYVGRPGYHVEVKEDQICLVDLPPVRYSRPSIDMLFQSAAAAFGPRVIAVVLSGCGKDGSRGISAVKAAGGVTIIEDPELAEYRDMPSAANLTGCVDSVLPLEQISKNLIELCWT
jgi:two-component system, chemotaxis family, protein-glutamate methylesterase/glutaminase